MYIQTNLANILDNGLKLKIVDWIWILNIMHVDQKILIKKFNNL